MYKIKCLITNEYYANFNGEEFCTFETMEDIREELVTYHLTYDISTNRDDFEAVKKMTLEELLEWGNWKVEDATVSDNGLNWLK